MQDTKRHLEKLFERFESVEKFLNLEEKKYRLKELEAVSSDPAFWSDKEKAKNLMQELGDLKKEVEEVENLKNDLKLLLELTEKGESYEDFLDEIESIEKKLTKIELETLLSGPYDFKNAIVSIHAGQGGTEAMDWASMLYRMYLRYSERKGWETEILDFSPGEEAGLKSVTFRVRGRYAYGYLKSEAGTHRLVRQSPFNADKLRHTSFALVEVLPELEEKDFPQYEIKEEDLEWQFFRASSQGGQNVQKVSTAVRLRHKPTDIVVTAQSQRYQEQNRKIALDLLRSKLWAREEAMKEKKVKELKGEYHPPSWGTQIRSYVLHPYKMVKDLRTNIEVSNPESVLDGDLDPFIEATLRKFGSK